MLIDMKMYKSDRLGVKAVVGGCLKAFGDL